MLRPVHAGGSVPPDTREIVVEVEFLRVTGVGDGYADELSLVLGSAP